MNESLEWYLVEFHLIYIYMFTSYFGGAKAGKKPPNMYEFILDFTWNDWTWAIFIQDLLLLSGFPCIPHGVKWMPNGHKPQPSHKYNELKLPEDGHHEEKGLPPWKRTARLWKLMVGRWHFPFKMVPLQDFLGVNSWCLFLFCSKPACSTWWHMVSFLQHNVDFLLDTLANIQLVRYHNKISSRLIHTQGRRRRETRS